MKRLTSLGVLATVLCAFLSQAASAADSEEPKNGKLRHVVLFAFKESSSKADIAKVEKAFGELPQKIDTIVDYEWGTNNSPEGLNDGFTHCFLVTFRDEAGRAVYLPHPAHKAFVKVLQPHLEKVLVIDFVAKE